MSTAILKLSEDGELQRIHDKWLLRSACTSQSTKLEDNRLQLKSFWGLFLISGSVCVLALLVYFALLTRKFMRHYSKPESEPEPSSRGSSRTARLQTFLSFVDEKENSVKCRSKKRDLEGVSARSTGEDAEWMVPSFTNAQIATFLFCIWLLFLEVIAVQNRISTSRALLRGVFEALWALDSYFISFHLFTYYIICVYIFAILWSDGHNVTSQIEHRHSNSWSWLCTMLTFQSQARSTIKFFCYLVVISFLKSISDKYVNINNLITFFHGKLKITFQIEQGWTQHMLTIEYF